MSSFKKMDLDNPSNFSTAKSYLTIAEREIPKESDIFFKNSSKSIRIKYTNSSKRT